MHLGKAYRGLVHAQWRWYARVTERILRAIGLDQADVEDWRRAAAIAESIYLSPTVMKE